MIKLTCQCCGFSQEFKDSEEAFRAGWDAPPHFSGYVACNLCPGVCLVLGLSHKMAHALWERTGRPKEFDPATCGVDADFAKHQKPN